MFRWTTNWRARVGNQSSGGDESENRSANFDFFSFLHIARSIQLPTEEQ